MAAFFVNDDPTNCGVTKCSLKAKGCVAELGSNNIEISSTAPYPITLGTNEKEGYDNTGAKAACITCNNEHQTIKYDNYQVSQTGLCHDQITSLSAEAIKKEITYDVTKTDSSAVGSLFSIKNDACKVNNCQLWNEECSAQKSY